MYKYIRVFFYLFAVINLLSCNKFLDVKPENQILDIQVYSSKEGIRNALNGIYINLTSTNLYGANTSMTAIDVLGQYYKTSSGTDGNQQYRLLSRYSYNSEAGLLSGIWQNGYSNILNINLLINSLKNINGQVLAEEERQLVLGEAYGLRAFVHFDLLRLFGPVYSLDSTLKSIPYKYVSVARTDTLLPANKVMANVLKDLDSSLNYLKNDPIISMGVDTLLGEGDVFLKMRNRRMNYFAVKALKARAALYSLRNTLANTTAKELINESFAAFPWNDPRRSESGTLNPDRIFSTEVIFGLQNVNMYDVYSRNFSASLAPFNILAPLPTVLTAIYGDNASDFRYRSWFAVDPTTNKTDKVFYKFADITNKAATYRNFQPLIRLTELYYIVAETDNDLAVASRYFADARASRGLESITLTPANRDNQIMSEYRREFWGEGQMFFYYKRKYLTSILDGTTGLVSLAMNRTSYVPPLPIAETNFQ